VTSTGLEASVVVPVHNEAALLLANTSTLLEYLKGSLGDYEVLLVENGSSDETPIKARGLAESGAVRLLELGEASLGGALKAGIEGARFDRVVCFPMDLSAELAFIPRSVSLLDSYDVVVGSKRAAPQLDCRPIARRLLSAGYHWLVRLSFGTALTDTTCVKAIRRSSVEPLLAEVPSASSVFETELLVAAERLGLRVRELPVAVKDVRPGRQPLLAKVASKARDLASVRVHVLAFAVGGAALVTGLALLGSLVLEKISSGQPGFLSPYSFLIAMLLVVSGLQMIVFGLLANLLLQVRRTVEARYSSSMYALDGDEG